MGYYDLFIRNKGLFSKELQNTLKNSVLAVAGAGGVGGVTLENLARMGVGSFRIADPEVFDPSNSNRQVGALQSSMSKSKAEILTSRLQDINPDVSVDMYLEGVQEHNVVDFVQGADVIIDAIDYFAPKERLMLYQESRRNNLYVISTPAIGYGALLMVFHPLGYHLENMLDEQGQFQSPKLLAGGVPYLSKEFFSAVAKGEVPSNACAIGLAGSVGALQAVKIMELKKDIMVMPRALRMDAYTLDLQLVNVEEY